MVLPDVTITCFCHYILIYITIPLSHLNRCWI